MCKVASWWEGAVYHRELSLVLCDVGWRCAMEGWKEDSRERGYVYMYS